MEGKITSKISLIIPLLIVVCLVSFPAYAKYSGGTGEPNDPYQIATAEDLMLLGESPEDYDKHFIMIDDIDLDPNLPGRKVFDKAVIAPDLDPNDSDFQGISFTGVFDGNGHTISNLKVIGGSNLGLFGQLASGTVVKNLGVMDVDIICLDHPVGGLAGSNGDWNTQGGFVTDCYTTGLISGKYGVGGLIGSNSGSINISYSSVAATGTSAVGGLVGENKGSVTNSHSTGRISGEGGTSVGGLVGRNFSAISFCYSNCSVSGKNNVGGLVGFNYGRIFASYSTSSTSGKEYVGGLVGSNRDGSAGIIGVLGNPEGEVANCYSTGTVRGYRSVGGLVGSNGYVIHITPEIPTPEIPVPIIPIPDIPVIFYEESRISNCYSTGEVYGSYSAGGLVGNSAGGHGITIASFWDIDNSGQIGSCGGVDKTTVEMQTANTFLEASWDFMDETKNGIEDIWWINEGQDYPKLWWEWPTDDLFFLVVDDFESYNDLNEDEAESNRIYFTWVDGWEDPTNGSIVDCIGPMPFCWPRVHSGMQSMPLIYDNSVGISEATANIDNLEIGRDWTIKGVAVLSLWFHGRLGNAAEPMYVALANENGTTGGSYHDNPNAAQIEKWTEWTINLTQFANQGVDLTNIDIISIGFGYKNDPQAGGEGHVKFDDIRLYRSPWPIWPVPVDPVLPPIWPIPAPIEPVLPPTWPRPVPPLDPGFFPPNELWPIPVKP